MRGSSSLANAKSAIADVRRKYARNRAIADALFVPAIMANMAGRLMVYDELAPVAKPTPEHHSVLMLGIGDGQDTRAFLNKPWDEALAWFRARGVVSDDELSRMLRESAEQSQEARRLMLEQVQSRVHDLLYDAIQEGQTYEQFADALENEAEGLGITTQDPGYLQNVFRTNVMSAYGAGKHEALSDPVVVEAYPYRQIRTAGDARVRDGEHGGEDHVQLDGLVYESAGPLKNLKTPFGFQCRCAITPLDKWDGAVITEMPADSVHEGFGY